MADMKAAQAAQQRAIEQQRAEHEAQLATLKAAHSEQLRALRGRLADAQAELDAASMDNHRARVTIHDLAGAKKATEQLLVEKQQSVLEAQAAIEEQRKKREAIAREKEAVAREAAEAQAALEARLERAAEGAHQKQAEMSAKIAKMSRLQALALGMPVPDKGLSQSASTPVLRPHHAQQRSPSTSPGMRRPQDEHHQVEAKKAKARRGRALLYWELTNARRSEIVEMGGRQGQE